MSNAKNYNGYLINEVITALGSNSRKKTKVLDFGAGSGTYAKLLSEEGIKPECLEPDATLQGVLKGLGFDVVTGSGKLKSNSYDLIYSLNVFEHIEKDAEEARVLFDKIKPGKKVLIYVPAFQLLYSSMDKKVGHYRRYRKNSLVAMMKEAGFEVTKARYCDPIGFFAALVFRFVGNSSGDISPGSVRLYDRYIFPISRVLEPLTKSFFGKNVLVVAQKNEN